MEWQEDDDINWAKSEVTQFLEYQVIDRGGLAFVYLIQRGKAIKFCERPTIFQGKGVCETLETVASGDG